MSDFVTGLLSGFPIGAVAMLPLCIMKDRSNNKLMRALEELRQGFREISASAGKSIEQMDEIDQRIKDLT